MTTIVQIDGDYLLHVYAFIAQHTYYDIYGVSEGEPTHLITTCENWKEVKEKKYNLANMVQIQKRVNIKDFGIAAEGLDTCMKAIMADSKASMYNLFLSGDTNFRNEVATMQPYKWRRDEGYCKIFGVQYNPRPHYYQQLRQHLAAKWEAIIVEGIEADDAMVISHVHDMKYRGRDSVLATPDKDMKQVHGRHFDISDKWKQFTISKKEAKFFLYSQVMAGDGTDCIPGIKGMGMGTAGKILDGSKNEHELFNRSADTWIDYAKRIGGNEEDGKEMMLETLKLVYMLRSEDIDHEHQKFYKFMRRYERDKKWGK